MSTAILLSGGVDSSVALHRLLETGEGPVTAFYLKIWLEDELAFLGSCPWEEDLSFARQVCAEAGVPLEVLPFQRPYYERVISYALTELRAGRTPSSDLMCNQLIKFGAFVDAIGPGFDRIASGHYARTVVYRGKTWLGRNPDPVKDQTYFLSRLSQEQIARCSFPLGAFDKTRVRDLARRYRLPNQDRKDSQGLCFLGKIPFDEFVRHHLGESPGEIREIETGNLLGEHRGLWFYTIGQRRGLRLSGGPWYVVDKDLESNALLVAHGERLGERSRNELDVEAFHWIADPPEELGGPGTPGRDLEESPLAGALEVKLRHGPGTYRARLEAGEGGRGRVYLDEADPGIAPGQFVVFYRGELCLGSAVIRG